MYSFMDGAMNDSRENFRRTAAGEIDKLRCIGYFQTIP